MQGHTFENGTDVFPYGYGSGSMELPQCQLHIKERYATKDGHQNVGNKESPCTEMHEGTYYVGFFHEGHDDLVQSNITMIN